MKKTSNIRLLSWVFRKSMIDMIRHDGVEHAGYLAFLSILSLFPFLVFFVSIAGLIGESSVGVYMVDLLLENLPENVGETLSPRINEIVSGPPQGLLSIAIIGAIWTASSAVEGLRTILNRAYGVTTPPTYVLRRLLSIAQFLMITAIAMVTILLMIVAPVIWKKFLHIVGFDAYYEFMAKFHYIRHLITYTVLLLVAMTLYYILPNIKQKFRAVAPGALVAILLWIMVGKAFAFYLNNFNQVSLIYGSLGGVIISLMFFYIINMIFIFGAEFNYHLEKALGHKLEKKE